MEDRELFDTLKNRPDIEPEQAFSSSLRRKLGNNPKLKTKKITVATLLTVPMTIAILVFLWMITTGQSLDIRSAALPIISQEKTMFLTGGLFVLLFLVLFIVFVFSKGYTKGKLVFMTFALSLGVWVGNLVYANWQRVAEPIVMPSQHDTYFSSTSKFLEGDSELLLSLFNRDLEQLREGNVDERSLQ